MDGRPLTERIKAVIASGNILLPVYPPVARQVMAGLRQPPAEAGTLAPLIAEEPALACGLFRAANSAFYQGLPKAATIPEAITRIGEEPALRLLAERCRDSLDNPSGRLTRRYLPPLWRHALGCALGAGWLASRCGYGALAGEAHLAGLLHETGKLLLLAALEQLADGDDKAAAPLSDPLIAETLTSMHPATGRELAAAWNLPDRVGVAITRCCEADLHGQEIVVVLVRLAALGCRKLGLGSAPDPGLVLPATAEAQLLGIGEIALAELEIMLEDRFGLAERTAHLGA